MSTGRRMQNQTKLCLTLLLTYLMETAERQLKGLLGSFQHLRMGCILTRLRIPIFRQVTSLTVSICSQLQGNVTRSFLNYNSHKAFLTGKVKLADPAFTSKETKIKNLLSGGCVKSAIL